MLSQVVYIIGQIRYINIKYQQINHQTEHILIL